jgi:hypothetical protein
MSTMPHKVVASKQTVGKKPADLTQVKRSSSLRWVPIHDITIDPEAQRQLSMQWVRGHVPEFDPEQLGIIVVNRRANGRVYCIDGQHRVALLREVGWGDQQIQCESYEGLTQAEEAELFLARNDRKSARVFDKFRIAITAKQELECDIDRIVRAQGLLISDQEGEGHVTAVTALTRIYQGGGIASEKEGPAALARTLKTIINAWGRSYAGFRGEIIKGIGLVQIRNNGSLDQAALAGKLAPYPGGPTGVFGAACSLKNIRSKSVSDCVAAIVVDAYNKGRRTGKLEDWWA